MNGWSPVDKKVNNLQPISGIVTNQEIGNFSVTAGGSRNLRVDLDLSGVTVVGSITAKLQMAPTGSNTYSDLAGANASVSITADGVVSMTQNVQVSADQPNMPLMKQLRVVITTTDAGDQVTIDKVWVSQEL